jgi:hypothetical protein
VGARNTFIKRKEQFVHFPESLWLLEAASLVTLILCGIIIGVVLEQGVSRDPLLF